MSDLIVFATELKKLLKESATFTDSTMTELSTINKEILGLDFFVFPEIKEQTPFQTILEKKIYNKICVRTLYASFDYLKSFTET